MSKRTYKERTTPRRGNERSTLSFPLNQRFTLQTETVCLIHASLEILQVTNIRIDLSGKEPAIKLTGRPHCEECEQERRERQRRGGGKAA